MKWYSIIFFCAALSVSCATKDKSGSSATPATPEAQDEGLSGWWKMESDPDEPNPTITLYFSANLDQMDFSLSDSSKPSNDHSFSAKISVTNHHIDLIQVIKATPPDREISLTRNAYKLSHNTLILVEDKNDWDHDGKTAEELRFTRQAAGTPAAHDGVTHPAADAQVHPAPPVTGGSVDGPCTVVGDIRSFEITCTKEIKSFRLSWMTTGKRFVNTGSINGVRYDMDIENQGTKIVGFEKLNDKIEFTINFTDASTAAASVWVAK